MKAYRKNQIPPSNLIRNTMHLQIASPEHPYHDRTARGAGACVSAGQKLIVAVIVSL